MRGDPKNYTGIAVVLFSAFVISIMAIAAMNVNYIETWLSGNFGQRKTFVLQLFFWASLGATIASYKFFADDKDINELESVKQPPDPAKLRWPNGYDVTLYAMRILFSGIQGVIGGVIIYAGLGFFNADTATWGTKQKALFVVFGFLIGIYQNDFLSFLAGLKTRLFQTKHPPKHDN